jgi:hypothetical protein
METINVNGQIFSKGQIAIEAFKKQESLLSGILVRKGYTKTHTVKIGDKMYKGYIQAKLENGYTKHDIIYSSYRKFLTYEEAFTTAIKIFKKLKLSKNTYEIIIVAEENII